MLINGRPGGQVGADDRGLLYGDGLFETVAVLGGRPRLWARHLRRLEQGCRRLGIPVPDRTVLQDEAAAEIADRPEGVLKILLTRGRGPRGYRPPSPAQPTRLVSFTPNPLTAPTPRMSVRARLCGTRLGANPALAGIKHLNRLEQVLARAEWDSAEIFEGLMQDAAGNVIEGTMSNLFLWRDGRLLTPDLSQCGVAGVARERVLDLGAALGMACRIADIATGELYRADGLLLTNSLIGYRMVRFVDDFEIPTDRIPPDFLNALEDALYEP